MVLWSGHLEISSSDTAMEALKWPTLRSRRDEYILKLVRKCMDGRCPQYFKNYFVSDKDICARSNRQSNFCICLLREQKWPGDFFFTMEERFLILLLNIILGDLVISLYAILPLYIFHYSSLCFLLSSW